MSMISDDCNHSELDKSKAPLTYGECLECGEYIMHKRFDKDKKGFVDV